MVSPDAIIYDDVKNKLNTGKFKTCNDVHVIANLISDFFQQLPVRLYSHISDRIITSVAHMPINNVEVEMQNFQSCGNNSMLLWYLDLLALVVLNQVETKFVIENLSIGKMITVYVFNLTIFLFNVSFL